MISARNRQIVDSRKKKEPWTYPKRLSLSLRSIDMGLWWSQSGIVLLRKDSERHGDEEFLESVSDNLIQLELFCRQKVRLTTIFVAKSLEAPIWVFVSNCLETESFYATTRSSGTQLWFFTCNGQHF